MLEVSRLIHHETKIVNLWWDDIHNGAVESTLKSDEEQAELLLDSVLAQRRSLKPAHVDQAGLTSFRLGIAGPPGAGKSTFIETLGQFLTAQGHKVAVLAIGRSYLSSPQP